ncbi:MAG: NUDIX domain-containing protein [Clostridia bacterium]|nr:NUDIX domain-containing protein [Clostridia bacterium]
MNGNKITLAPFDRARLESGRRAAQDLRRMLGEHAASVEHIGGTALRFVPSSPTLDFAVACPTPADLPAASELLIGSGFIPASSVSFPGGFDLSTDDTLLFLPSPDGGAPLRSVRLTLAGSRAFDDAVAIKNYLYGRPDVSREFAGIKADLAAKYPDDRAAYERGKDEWIKNALPVARHWSRLGKTVTLIVDRPMGSVHPDRPDLVYPINCGYPRDLVIPGESRLGVYILGVPNPVHTFTGRVIAVIFRENGEGVRWVVAPEGREYDQARILSEVWFRERDFKSTMEHLFHRSVGMVVYRNTASGYRFLLLRESRSQGWSIPKGHMEFGETELDTAIREVREETGLDCRPVPGFRREVSYPIPPIYKKTLVAFLAPTDRNPVVQPEEISGYRWVSLHEANRMLGGRRFVELINAAARFLENKQS